ncbi:MAG TPA: TRAP transporter large permease subunit [Paracoccaceae bacterium]|nr:TRAP transporter large permease subunit [Paracoccaceae bacterium]
MLLGLDGVEIGLIVALACLFAGILSGYPVAFAIGGAGILAFGIIAALDSAGLLLHRVVDSGSEAYAELLASGVPREAITLFRYPELPFTLVPIFPQGWELAFERNVSLIVNRMNERVIAGPSIETLLAVPMFVLMGIVLERSRIANDLLTTMARVFGPLPGGLAVSVVVVGAFLAASTGVVGATVVTMGLLSLPTMLRHRYSPELATGVICASGTLGQIIPPSIIIVLLGTLAGDIYSTAQEQRAQLAGCPDALTFLGEAAVVSVGTLFQAAFLPGILLALFYALFAFGFALLRPDRAPPVAIVAQAREGAGRAHRLTWYLAVPLALLLGGAAMVATNFAGSQSVEIGPYAEFGAQPELRTKVPPRCQDAMIPLHGQEKWDRAAALQAEIDAAGGDQSLQGRRRSPEEIEALRAERIAEAAPIGAGLLVLVLALGLVLSAGYGAAPAAGRQIAVGALGIVLALALDAALIGPATSPGVMFLVLAPPFYLIYRGCIAAAAELGRIDVLRVLFPPLILIVAVLGSILGGITNPTPASALGAGGAVLLAAYRRLEDEGRGKGRFVLRVAFGIVILLLFGTNFDLRINIGQAGLENWFAFFTAAAAYHFVIGGLLYACWILWARGIMMPVVRETTKVTSMVFSILIGSQVLNLVIISFGGESYIQEFLRAYDDELVVFLIVMAVLFILGFVLDFLEIIYIVIPIVGPVIYGGSLDPSWVTIMIAVNLQTSFLTPPFGFALFYLRGVAPPVVTTAHIYRGVVPFIAIQLFGLAVLWFFPVIITLVPDLLP